jgi:hypothetical protein
VSGHNRKIAANHPPAPEAPCFFSTKVPGMMGGPILNKKLIALFSLGYLLLNNPLLSLFNAPEIVCGIPLLFGYIFGVWLLLIVLVMLVVRSGPRSS